MKKLGSSLMAALILPALIMTSGATTAGAQGSGVTAVSGGRDMVTGTVVSLDNTQIVIKTKNGDQMTFHIEQNAFMPINLAVGNDVEVTYSSSGGQNVTNRIIMAEPGAMGLASNQTGAYGSPNYASDEGRYTGRTSLRARRAGEPSRYTAATRHRVRHRAGPTTGGETGNGAALAGGETGNGGALAENNAPTGAATPHERMPRGAGPLPLVALAGLLSAAAGYGIRRLRSHHNS